MAAGRQFSQERTILTLPMDLYLIRHAHAGSRTSSHHDLYRPLSEKGHVRASALVDLFGDVQVDQVISSPATRCTQTVEPLAEAHGLKVQEDEVLWENSLITDAVELMTSSSSKATVMCSHGDIIPGVIEMLSSKGVPIKGRGCEKGSIWVVTFERSKPVGARHVSKKSLTLD